MDAMNTMSNVEFLLIEKMAKESMKELRGEADTSRRIRSAGLAQPGLVERVAALFHNVRARLNRGLGRKSLRSHPTPGGKYAI